MGWVEELEKGASGLDPGALDNAERGEHFKKSGFGYDPKDYTDASGFVGRLMPRINHNPVSIDLDKLSVNGYIQREDMPLYLANRGNSSSALKEVIKGPAFYYFHVNDKANFVEDNKPHFELGTFAHEAFLEPELFKMVKVEPSIALNTKDGVLGMIKFYEELNEVKTSEFPDCGAWKMGDLKIYLDKLKSECPYRMIKEEHKLIIDMVERNYHRYGGGIIPHILRGAVSEASVYADDPVTGLPVKVRPDAFNIAENIGTDAIISFKTTRADNIGKFTYDAAKFTYELSEGMYQEVLSNVTGRKFNTTIMVMLQTVPPFLPAVFCWSADDLVNGKYKYRYALDTIRECMETGLYPGFEALAEAGNYGIIDMQLPEWSHKLLHPTDLED